jgi:hypothetical protein
MFNAVFRKKEQGKEVGHANVHVEIWLWALAHSPIQILKFSWLIHA